MRQHMLQKEGGGRGGGEGEGRGGGRGGGRGERRVEGERKEGRRGRREGGREGHGKIKESPKEIAGEESETGEKVKGKMEEDRSG